MAGAGASGLISAKCLLDEGFEVTVYEQEPHLGGLWRYGDSTDGTSLHPITSHCIAGLITAVW
jgi:phytoene dehydrogenase-like protein